MESEAVRGGSHGSHMYKNPPSPTHVNRDAPLPSPTSKPKAALAHRRFRQIRYEVNLLDYQTSTATISPSPSPSPFPLLATSIIMLAAASSSSTTWLQAHRIRYLFLLLCSPILIPFLCAIFPLLCAAELCLRLCCRRIKSSHDEAGEEEDRMGRCEEGRGSGSAAAAEKEDGKEEMGLLQRYLEDQLLLVGSVYDCRDDDSNDLYREIHDYDNDSNTTPLLA